MNYNLINFFFTGLTLSNSNIIALRNTIYLSKPEKSYVSCNSIRKVS